MKLFQIFPTHLIGHDLPNYQEYRDKLVRYCYQDRKDNPGVQISNNGGWQSEHKHIDILEDVYNEVSSILSGYLTTNFYFSSPWININPPGTSNDRHTHPGSDLSVVFYVKVPENSGQLEFTNPAYIESFNVLSSVIQDVQLSPSLGIEPVEGRILIFPAYMLHKVLVNKSDDDRISIAWNVKVEP